MILPPPGVKEPVDEGNVRSNTSDPEHRLVVIVLDSSIEGLWALARARDVGRKIVERLSPGDLAAVVFTADSAAGQDFTADRDRLRRAVDRLRAKISPANAGDATLGTLSNIVTLLAQAADRRKLLVFIASGIRIDVTALAAPVNIGSPTVTQGVMSRQHQLMLVLFGAARAANVNIYTVDPYGITVGPGGGDTRRLNREFLMTVAHNTGGEAIVNTNAFEAGVDRIFEQNRSYYVLGFEPLSKNREGHIAVRVARPDATVRAQSLLARATATSQTAAGALESLLPKRDIPLTGQVLPATVSRAKDVTIEVVIRIGAEWVERFSGDSVELVANAYDTNGSRKASLSRTIEGGAMRESIKLQFQLRPGHYQIRIAARSVATGAIGTLYLEAQRPR